MHCSLKNYYSKYFYILSIFIFILTVDCDNDTTPATKGDDNHPKLKNIRTFSVDGWNEFCKSFDIVLADINVLFGGISNVNKTHVRVLKQLENAKKKMIFYTSTMDITNNLTEKLKTLGYTTEFELFNPITALKWYFEKKISLTGKVYVIGDEELRAMIKSLDIEVVYHQNSVTLDEYITGYNNTLDNDVKAVIIGFDVNINLYKITQAHRYLNNSEVQLFMIQRKPIDECKYFDALIKKVRTETNRTKQYIDRLDGIFGDYLIEKNNLKDFENKVLFITSNASGNHNFTIKNKLKPLLIGSYKVKKKVTQPITYYYYYSVDSIAKIPACELDDE